MLREIAHHVGKGNSFAFETTLSGRFYARQIPLCQKSGYHVKLFFLRLVSAELAIARVHQRVLLGGHNVAEPVIRRRFDAGWRNYNQLYQPLVDEWALYDNSAPTPQLLNEGINP